MASRSPATAWPGEDKRKPSKSLPNWALRAPLSAWMEREGSAATGLRVLDVGCGEKPYLPYFGGVREYVGLDLADNPHADLHGVVEQIPAGDASFDLVICLQVLEHVDDPARAISELHRVLKPRGRLLLATHGTAVYHGMRGAYPDYWRWTHTGLERVVAENGSWSSVDVAPGAGTAACLGSLVATYLDLVFARLRMRRAGGVAIGLLNRTCAALDARSANLREPVPGSLFLNFHVTATR